MIILWHVFSLTDLLFPVQLTDDVTLESAYRNDAANMHTTLTDLKFTGYTRNNFPGLPVIIITRSGMMNVSSYCFLLPPVKRDFLSLHEVTFTGKIKKSTVSFQSLLKNMSDDLGWTESGITSKVSGYYISEPDYNRTINTILFTVIFGTSIYAILCIVLYILFIFFPVLSPCCQDLALFGNPKKLLDQAEEELATLPQLATEDMFITEHFFIETSVYGNAIIPIDQIIWIYKYSTLHKFFWYHFSISYTLHISANRHLYIQCPKNIKSDIDGIMDYLAEANHNILVGFNEKNRLEVQKIQGTPMNFEKFIAFLKKRI